MSASVRRRAESSSRFWNGCAGRLVAEGRIGDAILDRTGGAIPVDGIVGPAATLPDGTPVLLAGDAAGLTNPVTGAGIPAAVMSGAMAGEAAVRWIAGAADALDDYNEEIEDLFGASLRRAVRNGGGSRNRPSPPRSRSPPTCGAVGSPIQNTGPRDRAAPPNAMGAT